MVVSHDRQVPEPQNVMYLCPERNVGWLDEELLEPSEKIYGVHWSMDGPPARWQLTSQNFLRLDITEQFDSRCLLTAYTDLNDELAGEFRDAIRAGRVSAGPCGNKGFVGLTDDFLKVVPGPGEDQGIIPQCRWRVTNCSRVSPGFIARVAKGLRVGTALSSHMTLHPDDGFSVQFNAVPWDLFKRYWRKPINLDRRFHGRGRKYRGYKAIAPVYGGQSVDVLDFDLELLRTHKTFFADFSHLLHGPRKRKTNVDMEKWMLEHVRGFAFISDRESPFVRTEDEVLFTMEWL